MSKFKLVPSIQGANGVLDFDGGVYLSTSNAPASNGDYYVEFKIYLDSSTGFNSTAYVYAIGGPLDMALELTDDGILYSVLEGDIKYISNYPSVNTIHTFKIQWTKDSSSLNLYIDNALQSKSTPVSGGAILGNIVYIGGWNSGGADNLNNCTIWNLNLNGEHFYTGHPAGDTNAAWQDTVGSWNLTLTEVTSASTRNIQGSNLNVLKLDASTNSKLRISP